MLEAEADAERAGLRASMRGSETLKAAGLAAATLASNAIALLFTVLFARLLGADGYGSLAALISTFLILAVPGSALQVVVAREVATGTLGSGTRLASTLAAWRRGAAARVRRRRPRARCCCASRSPRCCRSSRAGRPPRRCRRAACGCCSRSSAARCRACTPTGEVGWSIVLEAGGRLVSGLCWWPPGLGVTGAYLGTPVSMAVTAVVLVRDLARGRIGVPDAAAAATSCATWSAAPGRP